MLNQPYLFNGSLMTNPIGTIQETTSPGTEIDPIITKLEAAIEGETRANSIMATTAMAIWLQNPGITAEQLHRTIKNVSAYICAEMESCDLENLPIGSENVN